MEKEKEIALKKLSKEIKENTKKKNINIFNDDVVNRIVLKNKEKDKDKGE